MGLVINTFVRFLEITPAVGARGVREGARQDKGQLKPTVGVGRNRPASGNPKQSRRRSIVASGYQQLIGSQPQALPFQGICITANITAERFRQNGLRVETVS